MALNRKKSQNPSLTGREHEHQNQIQQVELSHTLDSKQTNEEEKVDLVNFWQKMPTELKKKKNPKGKFVHNLCLEKSVGSTKSHFGPSVASVVNCTAASCQSQPEADGPLCQTMATLPLHVEMS